jgi:hypothetical protein
MTFESSISVTNASGRSVIFHLEPWGEEFEMPRGVTFVVFAEAEELGSFEVEHGDAAITVWAWPTAVVKIVSEDEEIGISSGVKRTVVPSVLKVKACRPSYVRYLVKRARCNRARNPTKPCC